MTSTLGVSIGILLTIAVELPIMGSLAINCEIELFNDTSTLSDMVTDLFALFGKSKSVKLFM